MKILYNPSYQFRYDFHRPKGFYEKQINFSKLINDIKKDKPKLLLDFDYTTYKSNQRNEIEVKDRETDEIFIAKQIVDIPFTVKDEEKEQHLFLYGKLNKKIANVRTDIYIARTNIDVSNRNIVYKMLFVYEGFDGNRNNTDKADVNRVAIEISTPFYQDYKNLFTYVGYKNNQIEEDTFKKFTKAFSLAKESSFDLAFLYNQAPSFVLEKRDITLLWEDLGILLQGLVFEPKEKAVLRVLRALAIDKENINEEDIAAKSQFKTNVNAFFYMLMLQNNGKSIFMQLYKKLNDYGLGDDNFTTLIQELYKFWVLSDFSNPDYYKNRNTYKGGPEVLHLDYKTQKVLGFYNQASDYNFKFVNDKSRLKLKITKTESYYKKNMYSRRPSKKTETKTIGYFDLFHPITLISIPDEGELKVPTNVIPAFYLKAMHDKLRWNNIEKSVWLGVDVVTTFTGIGNLAKLRHLRHLTKLRNIKSAATLLRIKTAVSIIEVSSGTLNILLTLADSKSEFAQKLQQYLFWLEIASLGTDVVVEKLLRKSTKEALDVADKTGEILDGDLREILEISTGLRKSQMDLLENWDNLPVSGRGRRGGQRISKSQMNKIQEALKKLGVDLELHPLNGSQTIKGFYVRKGVPAKMPEGAAAIFITDGDKMKIVLRKGATIYEFFHEFMHFRHAQTLGLKKYLDLGGKGTIGELVKEQWVFDKLMENFNLLTKDEIGHALWYINERVRASFDKAPIIPDFEISKIPSIRKEIRINDIINTK